VSFYQAEGAGADAGETSEWQPRLRVALGSSAGIAECGRRELTLPAEQRCASGDQHPSSWAAACFCVQIATPF